MSDLEDFFAEQRRRMAIPDEEVKDYIARIIAERRRGHVWAAHSHSETATLAHNEDHMEPPEPLEAEVSNEPSNASVVTGSLMADGRDTSIMKHKPQRPEDAALTSKRQKRTHVLQSNSEAHVEDARSRTHRPNSTSPLKSSTLGPYKERDLASQESQGRDGRTQPHSETPPPFVRSNDDLISVKSSRDLAQPPTSPADHGAITASPSSPIEDASSLGATHKRQAWNTADRSRKPPSKGPKSASVPPLVFVPQAPLGKRAHSPDAGEMRSVKTKAAGHASVRRRHDQVINSKPEEPGRVKAGRRALKLTAETSSITTPSNSASSPIVDLRPVAEVKPRKPAETAALAGPSSHAGRATGSSLRLPVNPRGKGKAASKPKTKEKEVKLPPAQYAAKLIAERAERGDGKITTNQFLKGKTIFYVSGDMSVAGAGTMAKMKLILKYGATLQPVYEPSSCTHIIVDALDPTGKKALRGTTLKELGLSRLSDVPPHTALVRWTWVVSGIGKNRVDHEFMHAAFSDRMPELVFEPPKNLIGKGKGKAKVVESEDVAQGRIHQELSHISEFTLDKTSASSSKAANSRFAAPSASGSEGELSPDAEDHVPSRKIELSSSDGDYDKTADPLAEFYAQAKAEHENEVGDYSNAEDVGGEADRDHEAPGTDDEASDEDYVGPARRRKRNFGCDIKTSPDDSGQCVNQDIVDKLEELMKLHETKPSDHDHWRAFSYRKSIPALRKYPKRIKSFAQARSIDGVGEKTALKIMEILQTGDLKRIRYENTEDVQVTRLFQGIYGVGRKIAYEWYALGLRTLDDVRRCKGGITLSAAQRIGLKFYDDINERMPREEAKAIFDIIRPRALALDSNLFIEIMGSYRRGKATCGDIDILITRPTDDGRTHAGILAKLLPALYAAGVLTEDLAEPDHPHEVETIYRGLCRLSPGHKMRRIDFLTVAWEARGAALLYYTGDDIFNRQIRMKARALGYSLNQRGLFANVMHDPNDKSKKTCDGTRVAGSSEREIFDRLRVEWKEPHERVRS